jgi:RNA polymerase sigma factor (sigma-70 family)
VSSSALDITEQPNGVTDVSTQATDQPSAADPRPSGSPLGVLLEGVTKGDWSAWHEIIKRFRPLVLHTATRAGLSSADAADVAQLTWLLLWKHGHQIQQPEHLAAWLMVASRREAIRLAGNARRYVLYADLETECSSRNQFYAPDVYPVEGDYNEVVVQALAQLPERYRTLLVLMTSDLCLTYAEIGKRMNLPIGSIGPMRKRALAMLENTPEFLTGQFPRPALARLAS